MTNRRKSKNASTLKLNVSAPSAFLEESESRPESSRRKEPSLLQGIPIHFIVESAESKAAAFDYFRFSSNPLFTSGIDPFQTLQQSTPTAVFLGFLNSPLGPCDPSSLSHTICLRYGNKDVEEQMLTQFHGEIPPNGVFTHYLAEKNTWLLFVLLDPTSPLAGYHAMRAGLLRILELFGNAPRRMRSSTLKSPRSKSKKNLKIPGVFREIKTERDKSDRNSTPAPAFRATSIDSSSSVSVFDHLTIHLGTVSTACVPHETFVWQTALAYRKLLWKPTLDANKLALRLEKALKAPVTSEESKKKCFNEVVKRNEVIRRGLFSRHEVNWLLSSVSDSNNPPMQLAATTSLTNYIQSDKPTLPFEISRKQVLDLLFKEHCLGYVLDLCAEGSVSIHRVIKESDMERGPLVGKGGTAVVYRAEYNGTTVAYKEFIEGAPLKEFYREVAMMSLLKHPCLVNIIGAGFTKENAFLVTEYVARGDLHDTLHEGEGEKEPLPESTIWTWATDIACGMQYLHSLGIIHRDLKSLNILITSADRCKIIDYGASRVVSNDNMTSNMGTVSWMAPEMFQGGNYTEKVDVYSYAMVLYEIFARKIPFDDLDGFSVPVQVSKGLRPKLPKHVPKAWIKLITQCWHDKPSKRPTFDRIVDTLRNFNPEK